jgi:NAD(P)H-hydrate epimerase
MSRSSSTKSSEEGGLRPRGQPGAAFPPSPQTRAAIRAWDRRAIEEFGIPGILLMENAGGGAARAMEEMSLDVPLPEPFRIVCGPGNNGGDGFVVARHLHNRGHDFRIVVAGRASHAPGSDASVNLEIVRRMRIPLSFEDAPRARRSPGAPSSTLFGSGLASGRAPFPAGCAPSARAARVIAVDIPLGRR